jgi:hypothetical protein
MACLSVISRELLVRARQPGTHRVRWLAAGLALAVLLPAWLQTFPNPALMGRQVFTWLSVLALACSLLEGIRQTAHGLSEERREGTLGLLLLTELSGWDVVLGKLVAASLSSAYSLLAVLPVLGLPLLTGGVSGGEFARMTLVLATALFLAQSVGLWVSSRSQDDMRSLLVSLGAVVALTALPPLLDLLLLHGRLAPATARLSLASPGLAFHLAFDGTYQGAPGVFWLTLGIIDALGWALLLAAARHLRRSFHPEERPAGAGLASGSPGRDRLLDADPVRWLARRRGGVPWWVWPLVTATMVVPLGRVLFAWVFPAVSVPMLGWGLLGFVHQTAFFVLRLLVAFVACRFFVQARRTGELELLLCTPLERARILRGHRRACWQVVFWPLVVVTLIEQIIPLAVWLHSRPPWAPRSVVGAYLAAVGSAWVFECLGLLADALALIWFGAWAALKARNLAGAVGRTLFYVILLPFLLQGVFSAVLGVGLPGTPALPRPAPWVGQAPLIAPDRLSMLALGVWLAKDLFFVWLAGRKLRAQFHGGTLTG